MAIKNVTSFSHTRHLWPYHLVVYVGGDLSRDMACVFKTGKITVYCFCSFSSDVGSECVGNGLEERRYGDLVEPMEEEGRRGYEMRVPPVMNGAIMNGAEEDGEC